MIWKWSESKMYMNLFDSHVHSDNSHDGEHSITFLCENAEQKI